MARGSGGGGGVGGGFKFTSAIQQKVRLRPLLFAAAGKQLTPDWIQLKHYT